MTTKIHAVTDGLGRCIDFTLTEGQIHDCTQAEGLLEGKSPENVLADKGYDADAIRACVRKAGANPVIPPRSCRKAPIEYDRHIYNEQLFEFWINLFDFFGLKYFRMPDLIPSLFSTRETMFFYNSKLNLQVNWNEVFRFSVTIDF
jgi:transposase